MAADDPTGEDISQRFAELAARWKEDTQFDSSPLALFQHPAHLEIISLGPRVVPLLLADLGSPGSLWFIALREVTGENPVPHEDRGKIRKMDEHWLAWGRAHGYVD